MIDVGLSFGPSAKAEGLIQPYKVSTWDTIPDSAKDADGYWYGDYYGVLAFEVNKDIVKNVAGRLGRPAEAGLHERGRARRRSARLQPGDPGRLRRRPRRPARRRCRRPATPASKFFAELNKAGNFVPVIGKAASLAQGATPIIIRWDYNALADRDTLKGNPPVEVVVPKTGVVAGVYVQAISAYAPHPNAAKLWMEYLYSDEGQLGWLKGYCHPIRFNDLAKNGKIPQELLAKLPPAAAYAKAVFPTLDEQARGQGRHHQAVGQRSSAPTSSKSDSGRRGVAARPARRRRPASTPSTHDRRPTRSHAAPRSRRAARGCRRMARRRAVLHLRAAVPDPADAAIWSSARSRTPTATSRCDNIARPVPAVDRQRLLDLASRSASPRRCSAR